MVGRELIRTGEAVFMLDTTTGLKLLPAQSWDVEGDPNPDSWEYSITLGGPSPGLIPITMCPLLAFSISSTPSTLHGHGKA